MLSLAAIHDAACYLRRCLGANAECAELAVYLQMDEGIPVYLQVDEGIPVYLQVDEGIPADPAEIRDRLAGIIDEVHNIFGSKVTQSSSSPFIVLCILPLHPSHHACQRPITIL